MILYSFTGSTVSVRVGVVYNTAPFAACFVKRQPTVIVLGPLHFIEGVTTICFVTGEHRWPRSNSTSSLNNVTAAAYSGVPSAYVPAFDNSSINGRSCAQVYVWLNGSR